MGPPLSQYPEQPSDQSKCELTDCPECKEKMWLSRKKKEIMKNFSPQNILMRCYDCLMEMVIKNPEFFKNHIRVDI